MVVIPSSDVWARGTAPLLIFILLVWVKRIFWMSRFRKTHPPLKPRDGFHAPFPKVSIVVPARNEEKNIVNCLDHLTKQDYPNVEIIVVDDRSSDATAELLKKYDVKTIHIEKLPTAWTGKNYAMFTGSKAASGEWLLFTDADTTHSHSSVQTALACALENGIDFLTLAPETESKSFWEKTVQPLAVGSLALWFNPEKVNDSQSGIVLANGQFILIKKDVYEKVGGNESVKTEVVEDVALAKKVRTAGFTVKFLNGTLLYSTRMYSSLKEINTGWTRIFTYLFEKKIFPILHKIFLFLFFSCLPFLILSIEIFLKCWSSADFSPALLGLSIVVCSWITLIRFIGNRLVRANPWYAFLHLLGSLVMVGILFRCIGRIIFKKASVWRGDYYP